MNALQEQHKREVEELSEVRSLARAVFTCLGAHLPLCEYGHYFGISFLCLQVRVIKALLAATQNRE